MKLKLINYLLIGLLLGIASILLIVSVSCATTGHKRKAIDSVNSNEELLQAADTGNINKVRELIGAGGDVNVPDNNGVTALMVAANGGHSEIVRMLINAGANVDATCIHINAVSQVKIRRAGRLLADALGKSLNVIFIPPEENNQVTALAIASIFGHTDVVSLLIEAGADVNAKDNQGVTALIDASGNGHIDIVKLLVEAEADVNVRTNNGWTALMAASYSGHTEVAKLMIEAGADVNAQNDEGYTALMYVEEKGHTHIGKMLKEAGAK